MVAMLPSSQLHRTQLAHDFAAGTGRETRRLPVPLARTHRRGKLSARRCRVSRRVGLGGARLATQVLPPGQRRSAFRPDARHREGAGLAGRATAAPVRWHRVAPAHRLRALAPDRRGYTGGPASPPRRAGKTPVRAGGRNPARPRGRFRNRGSRAGARSLCSDVEHGVRAAGRLRELEQSFRDLDRAMREKIATWSGGRGALLDDLFGERDAISDSDRVAWAPDHWASDA